MQIGKLDHVNLRTTQLDAMIAWYTDVLGMRLGPRPNFSVPGAWLYTGNDAAVHLVGIEGPAGTGAETELKLEHFSFRATGAKDFEARLKARGLPYRSVPLDEINLVLFNVADPDGNHIHIDFPLDEA